MTGYRVPLIVRGEIIKGDEVEFGGRNPDTRFRTVNVRDHLERLPLRRPSALADLHALSFADILDYCEELGARLELGKNRHLQEALGLTIATSGLGEPILRATYETLGRRFSRDQLRDEADLLIGIPFLEGWVNTRSKDGVETFVRAFGARALHIIAGNVPIVAAMTVARNTLTRSDIIIKTPSNDPLTAVAIAQTMIEMAPDHPITRHISVGYWKGGDTEIEERLYQPRNLEKIVAWGGLGSIKHITRYIQPGIDLITLDPKLSSSIIGRAAFDTDDAMREAARRLALDIAVFNQQGCLNARVVYAETGTDPEGVALANRFGEMVFAAIQEVPAHLSNGVERIDPALAEEIEGLRWSADLHKVYGGDGRGGVIVSQTDEPVEFSTLLNNRIANIVPVDNLEAPIGAVNSYTQTVGIHPPELIDQLRDRLAYHGVQRIVALGYVVTQRTVAGPQDSIEPLRRMCRWILSERHDPDRIPYWPWPPADEAQAKLPAHQATALDPPSPAVVPR